MKSTLGLFLLLLSLSAVSGTVPGSIERSLPLQDGTELSILTLPANGSTAGVKILWVPPEYGLLPVEIALARQVHRALPSTTVWLPDFFSSYFLPAGAQSLQTVGAAPVSEVIHKILQTRSQTESGQLFVITLNKGAALVLEALQIVQRELQQRGKTLSQVGVILINPNLYVTTPAPGTPATYWPFVAKTNLPIYILQAKLSPWRWSLEKLANTLQTSGSDVFVHLLPGIRDRFHFRQDVTPAENQAAGRLPRQLIQAMALLQPYMTTPRTAPTSSNPPPARADAPDNRVGSELHVYRGQQGRKLELADISGQSYSLGDHKGKVVLLNFWASWCPPCVHEIPSMVRLKEKLKGQPFEILAANLGEDTQAVGKFLSRTPVNFPILLDPDGSAIKSWQVSAYPTSYLVDKTGKIRFALFGGYEWDSAEAIRIIRQLLQE